MLSDGVAPELLSMGRDERPERLALFEWPRPSGRSLLAKPSAHRKGVAVLQFCRWVAASFASCRQTPASLCFSVILSN